MVIYPESAMPKATVSEIVESSNNNGPGSKNATASSTTSVDHRQHSAGLPNIPDQESDGPQTSLSLCA